MQPKIQNATLQPDATRIKNCVIIQKSRIRFCGVWTFLFVWSETRKIKCGADKRRRRGLDRAALLSAPTGADANVSRHSGRNRQFSLRKLAVFPLFSQNPLLLKWEDMYLDQDSKPYAYPMSH